MMVFDFLSTDEKWSDLIGNNQKRKLSLNLKLWRTTTTSLSTLEKKKIFLNKNLKI
jgi:hypothetical protein